MATENKPNVPFARLIAAFAIVAVALLPSCKKEEAPQQEVVSKRMKIEVKEEAQKPQGEAPKADSQVSASEPSAPASKAPERNVEEKEPKKAPVKQALKEPDKKAAAKAPVKKEPQMKTEAKKAEKAKDGGKVSAEALKAASSRPWAVNVASFPDFKEAKSLKDSLKASGHNIYITGFTKEGVRWYRVRAGFFKTEAEARKASRKIEKSFNVHTLWIVKPAREETAAHIKP